MIKDDSVTGQALAAAALISANVTPVVTMHIPFGGDNHNDSDLQAEADQTVSVAGIQALMTQLSSMSLSDKVTFATLNVWPQPERHLEVDGEQRDRSRSLR